MKVFMGQIHIYTKKKMLRNKIKFQPDSVVTEQHENRLVPGSEKTFRGPHVLNDPLVTPG